MRPTEKQIEAATKVYIGSADITEGEARPEVIRILSAALSVGPVLDGRWRVYEDATSRGWWGIELEQAGNDDEPILYPVKIGRERLDALVSLHNAALTAALAVEAGTGWNAGIETAPHATTVLASYFDGTVGEWIVDIFVARRPTAPFTHWMLINSPGERSAITASPASSGVEGEAVAWTGSGSMMALKDGRHGFIWPSKAESHPIPLYTRPAPQTEGK